MKTPKKLIGLAGPKGVGKTTTAEWIADTHNALIVSFAGPIKTMLCAMGVPSESLYGKKKEQAIPHLGYTGRYLMKSLGEEWGRNMIHKDLWVRIAKEAIENANRSIVVDDVRRENEAEMIRDMGGLVICLSRPGVQYEADHPTETELPSSYVDFYVDLGSGKKCEILKIERWKSAISWIMESGKEI